MVQFTSEAMPKEAMQKEAMKKINDLLNKMTLAEKAALVNGASFFGTAEFPELGIERVQMLDGGTGINFEQLFADFYSVCGQAEGINGMIGSEALGHVIEFFYEPEKLTEDELKMRGWIKSRLDERTGMEELAPGCFPPGMLLGATFLPEVVKKVGEALGMEAQAYGIDILLGTPNVNLLRDPLNGRLFEGYSEDPCLVAKLAPELVKGVQEYPVAANVKHFAANNQETNRIGINETISKRALEELYLPGFRACVQDGHVQTVMSAYNKINGTACTENRWLLSDTLRKEWGFDGMVMSDWGAVYHPAAAVRAGNDLAMPGPRDSAPILEAVQGGTLSEAELDAAVRNILGCFARLNAKKEQAKPISVTAREFMEQTDKAAYEAAVEGIVLLKNENRMFPIRAEENRSVTLTGTGCESLLICGSGSAGITTNRQTSLPECLKELLGENRVFVEPCVTGTPQARQMQDIDGKMQARQTLAADGKTRAGERSEFTNEASGNFGNLSNETKTVLVVASLSGMEGNDRPDMELAVEDRICLEKYIGAKKQGEKLKLGLLLNTCGPVAIAEYEPYLDGIFWMFLPGMQGARAMADLLTGRKNPSGKLPLTYPKRYEDTPTFLNFPGDGQEVTYGEGIYVGYRYYDKKKIKPLYAFGYGLSYTEFEISDVKTDKEKFTEEVRLSGKIKNTGKTAGAQVLQLYISDVASSQSKPVKELKAFRKIYLQPEEEKEFSFLLTQKDFQYFDMDYDRFLAEEGYFELLLATSSRTEDVAAVKLVYFNCESPYSFGVNSTIKVFYENAALKAALLQWWAQERLDRGILDSNYQYTASRKLSEIIPEGVNCNPEANESFRNFLKAVKEVIKE